MCDPTTTLVIYGYVYVFMDMFKYVWVFTGMYGYV